MYDVKSSHVGGVLEWFLVIGYWLLRVGGLLVLRMITPGLKARAQGSLNVQKCD